MIVHVGVPKSATSSLQFHCFSKHSEINYFGKPYWCESAGYEMSVGFHRLVDNLWNQDELCFDASEEEKNYHKFVSERLDAKRVNVLSEEGLTQAGNVDRKIIAERLKTVLKAKKIIITIRNQYTSLPSGYYWLYTRNLVSCSYNRWLLAMMAPEYYRRGHDFPLRQYQYDQLVKVYSEIFGLENVLVLPMEQWTQDLDEFNRKLSDFMGIDSGELRCHLKSAPRENEKRGRLVTQAQRLIHKSRAFVLNRILCDGKYDLMGHHFFNGPYAGKLNRVLASIDFKNKDLTRIHHELIKNYYSSGNKQLNDLLNLNLDTYRYPL